MDTNSLALFIHELRNQCLYTETALKLFNQALQQNAPTAVFFSAQATLTSASHIANLLWPPRARSKSRGEQLRKVLQLPEKHPLNDRRITALWDHADEKTEEWVMRTKGVGIAMDYVGPKRNLAQEGIPDANIYRLFDTDAVTFYYRGDGFSLQAVAKAIADISVRVAAVHQKLFVQNSPQGQPQPAAAAQTAPQETAKEQKPKKTSTRKPAAKKTAPAKKTRPAKKAAAQPKTTAVKKAAAAKKASPAKRPAAGRKPAAAKKPAAPAKKTGSVGKAAAQPKTTAVKKAAAAKKSAAPRKKPAARKKTAK